MARIVFNRILQAVPLLFGLTAISFGLLHLAPGGPAVMMLGNQATPALIAQVNRSLGLDHPLYIQYWDWLTALLQGNLGYSYVLHASVASLIAQNVPRTLVLVGTAIVISHLVAVGLGTYQALHIDTWSDRVLTVATYFLYAMPVFWLGLVLDAVIAVQLGWLPAGGISGSSGTNTSIGSYVLHLLLPATVMIIVTVTGWSRYLRASMSETLVQDYILTARAKGVRRARLVWRHALKNSVLPLITLMGMSLPGLFSGALIIEMIFNYPGMGLLFWNAAQQRDYPVLIGVILMVGVLTVVGNLLADLVYEIVDPRIRRSGAA